MDATRILEEYEANRAEYEYAIDPELFHGVVSENQLNSMDELYSPRWADRQREFPASC